MKPYKSLLLLLLLVAAPVMGISQTTLTQIKSPDSEDLANGGLYLIVSKSGSNYSGFVRRTDLNMEDSILVFWANYISVSNPVNLVNSSSLIRLYQQGDNQYHIYDATDGYYLRQESTNFKISLNPKKESDLLTLKMGKNIKSSSNTLQLKVNDRYLTYNSACLYGFYTEKNIEDNAKGYALLYRIQDLTGYGAAVNAESDLTDLQGDSTLLTLERTFSGDHLNTLMVPFPIDCYKEVFGPQVQAYMPDEKDLEHIAFKAVEGNRLEANTPYLLSGTFAQAPFLIPHTAVVLPDDYANDQATKAVNGAQFIGVYKDKELGNQDAYLLSNDNLYHCQNISSCHLGAFRWYMTLEENANSKVFRVGEKEIPTALTFPKITQGKKQSLYDVSGRILSSSSLKHHRLYLQKGRKIVSQ